MHIVQCTQHLHHQRHSLGSTLHCTIMYISSLELNQVFLVSDQYMYWNKGTDKSPLGFYAIALISVNLLLHLIFAFNFAFNFWNLKSQLHRLSRWQVLIKAFAKKRELKFYEQSD